MSYNDINDASSYSFIIIFFFGYCVIFETRQTAKTNMCVVYCIRGVRVICDKKYI